MRLFTIQSPEVYEQLAAGQPYVAYPRLSPESWLNDDADDAEPVNTVLFAYDWLCEQMQTRGLERPDSAAYPVWAYRQWAGTRRVRPDLRYSSMKSWSDGENRKVLFELEVAEERVLESDYDAWHAPLNYWYLGRPRESNAFMRKCKAAGLSFYRSKPLPDAWLHAELLQSWQLVFDMKASRKARGLLTSNQCIQATFWSLAPDDVVSATAFGGGRCKQSLPVFGPSLHRRLKLT